MSDSTAGLIIFIIVLGLLSLMAWSSSTTKEEVQICVDKCESINMPFDSVSSSSFLRGSITCKCGQKFVIPVE